MRKLASAKRNEMLNKNIEVRGATRSPQMNQKNNVVAFTHLGFSVATNKLVSVFIKQGAGRVKAGYALRVEHA